MGSAACATFLKTVANTTTADCVTQISIHLEQAAPTSPSRAAAAAASCGRPVILGDFFHVGWNAHVTQWFRVCDSPKTVHTDGTDCSNWTSSWPYSFTPTWCGAGTNAGTWADGGENATVGGPLGSVGVGYRIKMTNTGAWSVSCWNSIC
jgi:hypothetical protein